MPNIKPISDLQNYLDRYRASYALFSKLKKAEERATKEGWVSADDAEKELGVYD